MDKVFFEIIGRDGFLGDLAQCDHRILVVVAIDGDLRAGRHHARAMTREQDEIEAIFNLVDTVLDSDTGHGLATPYRTYYGKIRLLISPARGKTQAGILCLGPATYLC